MYVQSKFDYWTVIQLKYFTIIFLISDFLNPDDMTWQSS